MSHSTEVKRYFDQATSRFLIHRPFTAQGHAAMIYVDRAMLEAAITAGVTRYSQWMLCRVDGTVYQQSIYAPTHKHKVPDIIIPSLYPDGSGTRFALFCAWARNQEDHRRAEELIALAYGKVHACNTEGIAYAVPTIVQYFLTASEKSAWEDSQAARTRMFCDICLQQLNALGGRARYRWKYPDQTSIQQNPIRIPAWFSLPRFVVPEYLRPPEKDDSSGMLPAVHV